MDNTVTLSSYYEELLQLRAGQLCKPRMMIFYPTYKCNQHCYYCFYKKHRCNDEMTKEQAIKLLGDVKENGIKGVEYCGGGEPLCHPDMEGIIKAGHKMGLSQGILSNGVLFNGSLMKTIVEKCNYIRISLETVDPELYLTIRGSDDCEKVLSNIEEAIEYRNQLKTHCQISVKVGISKKIGLPQIQQVVDHFAERSQKGIDSLQIKHLWNEKGIYYNNEINTTNLNSINKYRLYFLKKLHCSLARKPVGQTAEKCWLNPLQVTIDARGDVFLCCYYMGRDEKHRFGNILQKPFKEIWGSEEHKIARNSIQYLDCLKHDCRFKKYMRIANRLISTKDWNFI